MIQPTLSRNGAGSWVITLPIGEIRIKGGGWTCTGRLNRQDLNAIVRFCNQRASMTKEQQARELARPEVLDIIIPNWKGDGQKILHINDIRVGKEYVVQGSKYSWMGKAKCTEIRQKKVIVRWEGRTRGLICSPEMLAEA